MKKSGVPHFLLKDAKLGRWWSYESHYDFEDNPNRNQSSFLSSLVLKIYTADLRQNYHRNTLI